MMTKQPALKSIELFAGGGGLALGVARAGFNHSVVLETDPSACKTLRANKTARLKYVRDWDIVEEDIAEYDFEKHANSVALLCGGPPCQPFSIAGHKKGRNDPRDLFPEAIRAVREARPKAFLFENVRGLKSPALEKYFQYTMHRLRHPEATRRHRETWKSHLARLEKLYTGGKSKGLRYNVIWQVLRATDFGVPQRRDRLFIVGVRADLGVEYAFPTATHARQQLLYDQWISEEYWQRHDVPPRLRPERPHFDERQLRRYSDHHEQQPWITVRDAIDTLPTVRVGCRSHKVTNHFLNDGARAYERHSGSALDWPSKTLKAGHNGVPGGENMVRFVDGTVRYFSVRECARLQTFPDHWRFEGNWTTCMRQVGNAVPVLLAEIVARPLFESLHRQS